MNARQKLTLLVAVLAMLQTASAHAQSGTWGNGSMQTKRLAFSSRTSQAMGIVQLAPQPSQSDILRAIHQNRQRSERVRQVVQNLYGQRQWTGSNSHSAMGTVQLAPQPSQDDILRAIHERRQRDARIREVIEGMYGNNADSNSAMGSKTLDQQHTTVHLFPLPVPDQQDRARMIPPGLSEQQATVRLIAPWSNDTDDDDDN